MLRERDTELRTAEACLTRAADGGGGVLLVEGSPGIGKTTILRAVTDAAAGRGFRVLRARGAQLERPFPFGVARQLLERPLLAARPEERDALLAGAAGDAPAALGMTTAGTATDQGLRGLHALYWLAANLAGRGPLVLVIDDGHWADRPSLSWLAYLADRLEGVPLLVVLATRDAEPGAEQDLLDALAQSEHAAVVRPQTLSDEAVDAVVQDAFGQTPSPAFSGACGRATDGNPLLLGELLRELKSEGVEPTDAGAVGVVDFGADGIARTVRRRLSSLGPQATLVAEAVAVAGDGEPLGLVAQVAELDEATVRHAAGDLIATDVFATADRPTFAHALVRAAVYRGISPPRRVALHARAAGAVAAAGDGVAAERLAAHLLHTDPGGKDRVVDVLLDAAADATRRGAPDIAAAFATRALAEPPTTTARRATVLRVLGTAEATAVSGGYEEHLREAMRLADDPAESAECALILARAHILRWNNPAALDVLRPALDAATPESDVAVRLEAELLTYALGEVTNRDGVADLIDRRTADFDAGRAIDPRLLAPLSGLFIDHPPARRAAETARLATRSPLVRQDSESVNWMHAALALSADGAYADTLELADAMAADARRCGAAALAGLALICCADALGRRGALVEAEASVVGGLELLPTGRLWPAGRILVGALAGEALAARGATVLVEQLLSDLPMTPGSRSHQLEWSLVARGKLRFAQGRVADAVADLRAAQAQFAPGEFRNPYQCRWRSPLALALTATGESRAEARALVADELADARRFEAAVHIGAALSASGVVTGGPAGVAQLREAVAVLAPTEGRLDHARALVRLGTALTGEEARKTLRAGLDLAARCGATPLADEAHEALRGAGGRPRQGRRFISGPESLTAGEYRVARLVAEGLTNREVAQQLYVTQAAVQFHLRGVFRKLDITSRTQLPAALAGDPPPASG